LLLKDHEWNLLERIINALKPLELVTKFFSGSKYPTLSIIVEIDNEYDCDDSNNIELDILDSESDDEFYSPDSVFYKYDTRLHTPPDLNKIEQEFKNAIFNFLNKYWYDFYEQLNITSNNELEQETLLLADTEIMQNPFFEGIFGTQEQEDTTSLDEIARYLDIAPINYNYNPW
ncbi:4332_t:CDS:2, partial [Scutellospora calospora]